MKLWNIKKIGLCGLLAVSAVPAAFAADPVSFGDIATTAQGSYMTFLSTAAGPILGICLVVGGFAAIKKLVSRGVR